MVLPGEGDRHIRPLERCRDRGFSSVDFPLGLFARSRRLWDSWTTKYDVDGLDVIGEPLVALPVIVVAVGLLFPLTVGRPKGVPQEVTIFHGVLAIRVIGALFLEELGEFFLTLLGRLGAPDGLERGNGVVGASLMGVTSTRVIASVFVVVPMMVVVVVVVIGVVVAVVGVVALSEALHLLVFYIGPLGNKATEFF